MAHATKEKARAYQAAYREKNRERLKAYRQQWYRDNIDRERERARKSAADYRERHPERQSAANRKFYEKNKASQRERAREWARLNPRKVKTKKRRGAFREYLAAIWRAFGLTPERYYALLGEQNGLCRICRSTNDGEALHVDHVHADGYESLPPILKASLVRGLLCVRCNTGLGSFRDNPELLTAAAHYLGGANV